MTTKFWFTTNANRGIGAEIAKAALTADTFLPAKASVCSWPSPKSESLCLCAASRRQLQNLVSATPSQDAEPRRLPSLTFTPSGPLVYQWQINRRSMMIRPEPLPNTNGGCLANRADL
jgi:hypothetical protein